jgi:hypothetical protein
MFNLKLICAVAFTTVALTGCMSKQQAGAMADAFGCMTLEGCSGNTRRTSSQPTMQNTRSSKQVQYSYAIEWNQICPTSMPAYGLYSLGHIAVKGRKICQYG